MKQFNKITIIGVGLIGGSIGLALKDQRLAKEVVGVGHHIWSIRNAIKLNSIDRGTLDFKDGVRGADLVIFATPVLTMASLARKIKKFVREDCIITDVGSVKKEVVSGLEKIFSSKAGFVGGHPMAGSEKRGVNKARRDLFRNSMCILTKTKKTNPKSLKVLKKLWISLGAKVIVLSPEVHDNMIAEISHLPHMVAFAIMNSVKEKSLKFASSGFSDTTRIASSDARVWKDIAISNRRELLSAISAFKKELLALEKAIQKRDSGKLLSAFSKAKKKRDSL